MTLSIVIVASFRIWSKSNNLCTLPYAIMHPKQSSMIFIKTCLLAILVCYTQALQSLGFAKTGVLSIDIESLPVIEPQNILPPSKYPSITRDVTVALNNDTMIGALERRIWQLNLPELKAFTLKDVYPTEEGNNVTWSIEFQSSETTLKDKAVEQYMQKIRSQLSESSEIN